MISIHNLSFGYKKNWSPQTDFASALPQEYLEIKKTLEEPHTKITIINDEVKTKIIKPEKIDTYESLLINKEAATKIAEVRALYRSVPRTIYSFDVFRLASLINTGDYITIKTGRFGLKNYPCVVISIEDPIVAGISKIKVIKWIMIYLERI
jgi:hypothetical protein